MKSTKKTKAYKATMKKIKKLPVKFMKAEDVPEGAYVIDGVGDFLSLHSDGNFTLWGFGDWSGNKGYWDMQELTGVKQIKIKRKKKAKPVLTTVPTPADLPSFPFKLSCGDKPEVRQWLKSVGCAWSSGADLSVHRTEDKNLYVQGKVVFSGIARSASWKELNLFFLDGVVVDWSCSPSDKIRLQEALDSLISANNKAQEAANVVQQIIDNMED